MSGVCCLANNEQVGYLLRFKTTIVGFKESSAKLDCKLCSSLQIEKNMLFAVSFLKGFLCQEMCDSLCQCTLFLICQESDGAPANGSQEECKVFLS